MPPKKNLKLSAVRLRRLSEFSRGAFLAAAGGEMRSDYFKNTAPVVTCSELIFQNLPRSIINQTSLNFMDNTEVGKVSHWYDKLGVAVVKLTGNLKVGDRIKVVTGGEEFEDSVPSMQVDHKEVQSGKAGDEVAIKLSQKAKEGSVIHSVE